MFSNDGYVVASEISSVTKWFWMYIVFQLFTFYFYWFEHNENVTKGSILATVLFFFCLLNGLHRLHLARVKDDSTEGHQELSYAFGATYASFFLAIIFVFVFQNQYHDFYKENPDLDEFKPNSFLYLCVAGQAFANLVLFLTVERLKNLSSLSAV